MRYTSVLFVMALAFLSHSSIAQQLVHTPRNPSFGGNPFNSAHFLATAEIDRPEKPKSDDDLFGTTAEASQTSFFIRQLESRILSRLSLDITEAIFGDGAEPSGTFAFNETTLTFETLLDGTIVVNITDLSTGGTTTIEVPAFLTGN